MPSQSSNPSPVTLNSRITGALGADFEALKNDLEQATEFAVDLQKELALNKNDAAHFKQLFEKAARDLGRMNESILALRKERHAFANEVMIVRAQLAILERVAEERDEALAAVQKRDEQVAELTMQILLLKNTFRHMQETRAAEVAAKRSEDAFLERFGA